MRRRPGRHLGLPAARLDELGPIDWLEVHRRGLQGSAYLAARLAGSLTPGQEAAAAAVRVVHHARQLEPSDPDYADRHREALALAHLVPFRDRVAR